MRGVFVPYPQKPSGLILATNATKTYFTYDSSDRNTGITETNDTGSITTTYARDVQGRLLYRHHDTNSTNPSDDYYAYTASGDSPDFITDLDGTVTEKYFTLPGGILLTIRPERTSAGVRTYSLPNIHGDTMATIDADGLLTSQTMTGPFGEKLPDQPDAWNTLNQATFGYVGSARKLNETTTATRPIQMGARVYIPGLGRFLQVDSVQGGTPNNYVYPTDPVNDSDLTGQFSWKFWQKKKVQTKKYTKPNAVKGYLHWAAGGGKSITMPSNSVKWSLDKMKLQKNVGKTKVHNVGAYGRGFNSSEHVGGATGSFTGNIKKTASGYSAVGTYKPADQMYDFDFWKGGSAARVAATSVGYASGIAITLFTRGATVSMDYEIKFTGEAKVDMSW